MRRTLVLVALALAGGLIVGSARAATMASAKASLEVVSVDPLRVAGSGFKTYERVRITAWVDGTRTTAQARAGRRGAFHLRLADATGGPACRSSVTLVAVGSRGSRTKAVLHNIMCTPTS